MNSILDELLAFFKFQNGLKTVLRNNWMSDGRKESSAEHSWSVGMMTWLLTKALEKELNLTLDQNKSIKMALIHDIVEIEAGDVAAWDKDGREAVKSKEMAAISKISDTLTQNAGHELYELWIEHEERKSIESKLVKACDQLCPLVYRVVFNNSYKGTGMNRAKLDGIFMPIVNFSKTTEDLYLKLAEELESKQLFDLP